MSALQQLGHTQQALLRHLLRHPNGADVESLCERLRVSHNAVRQHLTALIGREYVERAPSVATGGRPQSRYRLTTTGHALFPRNYGLIANGLLETITERLGPDDTRRMLIALGARLGAADPVPSGDDAAVASALADRLNRAGYEAVPTQRGGAAQVEAFNCVFHSLARRNADVCRFDIAFMEAATGRRIQHTECIVRGGHVCRFQIASEEAHSEPNSTATG
jgi:predicted ArsR family transcriptional regulator